MPRWMACLIASALGLWLSWVFQAYILRLFGGNWDPQVFGQWGDTFGALNALFATLGFGAALYTLRIQQQQIARDRFDTTFFELLKLLIDAREKFKFSHTAQYSLNRPKKQSSIVSLNPSRSQNTFVGLDAFQAAWFEFRFWNPDLAAPLVNAVTIYDKKIHGRSESTLGPYYRLLYTILKRIERDPYLSLEDKYLYSNLVRSQMTQYEIGLAGLNGMSAISKDFDILVMQFRLLKYLTGSRRTFFMKHYPFYVFEGRS